MTGIEQDRTEPRRSRIALLDDHELLLDSLSSWIRANEPQFELVLAVGTWVELVHSPAFPTDLVLMDLQLAERVSIEARVRTCRAAGAKVIVLTALTNDADRERALSAGASAFLTKTQPVREVMAAVRTVMGVRDPQQAERSRRTGEDAGSGSGSEVGTGSGADSGAGPGLVRPRLSDGEMMALGLYAAGRTTVEVAASMGVGYETAKTYLRRVREKYTKAGRPTSSRSDLIRRAAEDGYLT